MLTAEEQRELLNLARAAIAAHLAGNLAPSTAREHAPAIVGGVFVTLYHNGELCGCLGRVEADQSVTETVVSMAVAAATQDPRFRPLELEDLAATRIEISILSPLARANPAIVEIGRHGVVVSSGTNRGLLLPQVATKYEWDRERFLAETCLKAGLMPDAWQQPDTEIFTFEAEVIRDFEGANL